MWRGASICQVILVLWILSRVPSWSVSSHAANRAPINILSLGLSGLYKSFMLQRFYIVALLFSYCRCPDSTQKMTNARPEPRWPCASHWTPHYQLLLLIVVLIFGVNFDLLPQTWLKNRKTWTATWKDYGVWCNYPRFHWSGTSRNMVDYVLSNLCVQHVDLSAQL